MSATDEPDTLLILRPLRDPMQAPGVPARDAEYRLKLALKTLLRSFGLKCVRACNVPVGTKPANVKADEPTEVKP